ncbi:synaptonemal complex central element protein 2 isoform 2-T2 [Synchiropus picturatus]
MDLFFTKPGSTPQKDAETEEEPLQQAEVETSSGRCLNESQMQDSSWTIDDIRQQVQLLVEKINERRAGDQDVIKNFNTKLVEEATRTCQLMQEHMYTFYEANSNDMQVKLQELGEIFERCSTLNKELMEAMKILRFLRPAMNKTAEPQD